MGKVFWTAAGSNSSCRWKIKRQGWCRTSLNLTGGGDEDDYPLPPGEGLLCIGHNHVPIAVHVSPGNMRPLPPRLLTCEQGGKQGVE